jgi:AraC family transcriptional regulator of adaptative response / methylphosphotriester-DNA alkyltransferase methyltransferase
MKRAATTTDPDDFERWNAVVNCDMRYDGVFLYGVRTTGIFCRPSCKSKTPLRKHVEFFTGVSEAMKAGFRACRRCRPDLLDEKARQELAELARSMIDGNSHKTLQLSRIAKDLGVNRAMLATVFRENYGETPEHYHSRLRIERTMVKIKMAILDREKEKRAAVSVPDRLFTGRKNCGN